MCQSSAKLLDEAAAAKAAVDHLAGCAATLSGTTANETARGKLADAVDFLRIALESLYDAEELIAKAAREMTDEENMVLVEDGEIRDPSIYS